MQHYKSPKKNAAVVLSNPSRIRPHIYEVNFAHPIYMCMLLATSPKTEDTM